LGEDDGEVSRETESRPPSTGQLTIALTATVLVLVFAGVLVVVIEFAPLAIHTTHSIDLAFLTGPISWGNRTTIAAIFIFVATYLVIAIGKLPGYQTRLRGRCLRGQRLRSMAPFGHWMTPTFVAGLRCDRLTAPFFVNAPMDRRIFETYVEKELAPTLAKDDVVIMDNLPAHKSKAAEKAIKARGAWVLFLPPYSPDLNPIEMAFAKLKTHLRARAVRTIDALWQEIGRICDLFDPAECQNYFAAAGYGFS
jgi:transposase